MRYPVRCLLDGSADEDFIHVVGLVRFNRFPWIKRVMQSIIVVVANTGRRRDFTHSTVSTVGQPVANIRLSNVRVGIEPEATPDKPTTHAMLFSGIDGLMLNNVKVTRDDAAA